MTIEKTLNGMIVVSDIVDGFLVTKKYMGYTVKEARSDFKRTLKRKPAYPETRV